MQTYILLASLAAAAAAASVSQAPHPRAVAEVTTYTPIAPEDVPDSIKISSIASAALNTTATAAARRGRPKRTKYGVYLCTDDNWEGTCVHIVAPGNVCVPLGPDLNQTVTSVGPDEGGYCRFYWQAGCVDDTGCFHIDLTFPGTASLNQGIHEVCRNNPNDHISSYMCWQA